MSFEILVPVEISKEIISYIRNASDTYPIQYSSVAHKMMCDGMFDGASFDVIAINLPAEWIHVDPPKRCALLCVG
jgi:hypothetical protein